MNGSHGPDEYHDEQLSRLYRQTSHEEPPMALDSAILQRARKATQRQSWRAWFRRFRIAPLVATTAVALLTVSVVIQMRQQHPKALAPSPLVQSQTPANKQNEVLSEGFADREKAAPEKRKATSSATAPGAGQAPAAGALRQTPAPAAPTESKAPLKKEMEAAEPIRAPAQDMQPLGNRREKATDAVSGSATPLAADIWIKRIQALLKAGKKEEAKTELAKFIEQYPERPLPTELLTLRKEITAESDG